MWMYANIRILAKTKAFVFQQILGRSVTAAIPNTRGIIVRQVSPLKYARKQSKLHLLMNIDTFDPRRWPLLSSLPLCSFLSLPANLCHLLFLILFLSSFQWKLLWKWLWRAVNTSATTSSKEASIPSCPSTTKSACTLRHGSLRACYFTQVRTFIRFAFSNKCMFNAILTHVGHQAMWVRSSVKAG